MSDIFKAKINNQWVGIPALQGEKGEKGDKGDQGIQGPATIAVGTTTTGQPGTNASVTNSGTTTNVVLDFTIPEGDTGAAAGINSATATVTELGRNATPTVSASVSGPDTAKDFSFAFGLPKVSKSYWVTVPATGWTLDSSTGRYTKTVTYSSVPIASDSLLWIGADPGSMDEIYSKVIYPSGQGDHSLTFTAYSQPTQTVTFGVMIV